MQLFYRNYALSGFNLNIYLSNGRHLCFKTCIMAAYAQSTCTTYISTTARQYTFTLSNNSKLKNVTLHFQGVQQAILWSLSALTLPQVTRTSLSLGGHYLPTNPLDSLMLPNLCELNSLVYQRDDRLVVEGADIWSGMTLWLMPGRDAAPSLIFVRLMLILVCCASSRPHKTSPFFQILFFPSLASQSIFNYIIYIPYKFSDVNVWSI